MEGILMLFHRLAANLVLPAIPNAIWSLPQPQPVMYLTFDDGPYPPVTRQILQILKDYQVPATFFLQGSNLRKYEQQVTNLDYQAHQLGNHGFSHTPLILKSKSNLLREIEDTRRLIEQHFLQRVHLLRPPYGLWGRGVQQYVQKNNMGLILWSLMTGDFKLDAAQTCQRVVNNWQNGDILVFHDSAQAEKTVLTALPKILEFCKTHQIKLKCIGD